MIMSVGFGRPEWAETNVHTMQLARAVNVSRGERRGLRLEDLAWHLTEYEYGPFLHLFVEVHRTLQGHRFRPFTSIGSVLRYVTKHHLLQGQEWADAAFVRNAASHNGGWRVNLDKKTIVLRNQHNEKVTKREVPINALLAELVAAAADTAAIPFVVQRAFRRDMISTCEPALVEFAKTGDEGPLEAAVTPFALKYRQTWQALRQLGWPAADAK